MRGPTPSAECLRNKREVARYLGVSLGTVERMIRAGLLPYIKLSAAGAVRFRLADVIRFVEERRVLRTQMGATK